MNNSALTDFAHLVGMWKMTLYGAAFLPNPDSRMTGRVEFDWVEGGAALVMRQALDDDSSRAVWIVGRDEAAAGYEVQYSDDRGSSRRYEMSLVGRDWTMWRITPEGSQRFEAVIERGGRKVNGVWRKSSDGGATWEHDFNLDYIRVSD